jgi:hypothetical protein
VTDEERTGIELLLSEPEIVAWLGTDETADRPARAAEGGVEQAFEDALERTTRTRRSGARTRGVANAAPMQRRRLEG